MHLFVCVNRREGSPLGPGCGERGDALYDALKNEVAAQRKVTEVWVTKTHCLGICPKRGATVARYGAGMAAGASPIRSDVELGDIAALLADSPGGATAGESPSWTAIEEELSAIEELQTKKVLDLARRLKPGLTMEDVQNPHDFPELDDPDWHYADGILTGMKSVTTALRGMQRRGEGGEGGE